MLARKLWRDLAARRVRSALTLLGVLVGVAGLVAIVTTTQGFARAQRAAFASGERADLALFLFNAPESVARVVERVPGVLAADLRTNWFGRGRLGEGAPTEDLHFLGLRAFDAQRVDRVALIVGAWPGPDEALVEPTVAARYDLQPGDTLFFLDSNQRLRPLRLSGIARLPSILSSDITGIPLLFVHDSVTQQMADVPGYNELLVRLEPGVARERVGDAIVAEMVRRAIPRGTPRFSDPSQFAGKRELDTLFVALYLFSALGLLLTGFIVANTLAALVTESVREIGVLKALGATRRQLLGTFAAASLLYGALGTLLGLPLGTGLGFVLLRLLGRVASIAPPLRAEPTALALGAAVGLAVPLLGGALPTWQAASLTAKAALESRGVSQRFGQSRLDEWVRRVATLPPLPAMGLRNLLRRKGRSAVTLLVVALAVGALLAAQGTDRSVAGAIGEIFDTYTADAYLQFGSPVRAEEAGLLRRVPGVLRAEPWLLRSCAAAFSQTRCWGLPADGTLYRPALVAGQWLDPREPLGVVLSDDLARTEGLGVGSTLTLRYRAAEQRVTVRGIVRDNAIFLGSTIQSKLFVPRSTLATMVGDEHAADLFATALEPRDIAAQRAVLDEATRRLAALRPSGILALSEFESAQELTRILTLALRGMVILVAGIGAVGLVNTLALSVLERRRELGVLRSLGIDNRQVLALFLAEGLGLGLGGWLLGLGLGWGLAFAFVQALATTLFQFPLRFPPLLAASSFGFALALALLASIAPALAAARLPTAEALRYE